MAEEQIYGLSSADVQKLRAIYLASEAANRRSRAGKRARPETGTINKFRLGKAKDSLTAGGVGDFYLLHGDHKEGTCGKSETVKAKSIDSDVGKNETVSLFLSEEGLWYVVASSTPKKRTKYFILTQPLEPCFSAMGTEVKLTTPGCPAEFDEVEDAPEEELWDVSNAVRFYNLVNKKDSEDEVPEGSYVEAIREGDDGDGGSGSGSEAGGSGSSAAFWRILQIIDCSCGSSSSSASSGSSGSSDKSKSSGSGSGSEGSKGSESQSEKSTAIVPASFTAGGYTALFVEESPEVRFDDIVDITVPQVYSCVPLDPRFVEVCEPNTIVVCGCSPDKPVLVSATVEAGSISIQFAKHKPKDRVRLVIRVVGIRKGFMNLRFPSRSQRQFEANERFINSAYPAE